MAEADVRAIVSSFIETYDESDSRDVWFEKVKAVGMKNGYAENGKLFKAEPEKFKGTVGDVAKVLRVLLSGRTQTADLWSIMRVMGKERVFKRLSILK
jgi:glutamyl-tRNA synthetase